MNDLKEFWDDMELTVGVPGCSDFGVRGLIKSLRQEEGMVFWERGGKQFVNSNPKNWGFADLYYSARAIIRSDKVNYYAKTSINARDFLDCLACLGDDKVKELIEKEGVKNE